MTTRAERNRKRPAVNVLNALMREHWAILPASLQMMAVIAQRQNLDVEAIELQRGEPLRNTHTVTVRDGVATIPVHGPMFRYADFFSRVSAATTYEDIATDFRAAMDDPRIKAIVFDIDSPGGEVNGCAELARAIHSARGVKPIIAYVPNWACSAAYWMATACDEIVAHETSMLGSIGCIAAYLDDSKQLEAEGLREIVIVSSQSPNKDANPATADGRSQIQVILDDLAAVFIADVARFRGVSTDLVLSDFGQGGVFVGAKAVSAGMADRLGNYEALHAELLERETTPTGAFVLKARANHTIASTTGDGMKKVTGKPAGARAETDPPKDEEEEPAAEGSEPEKEEEGEAAGKKKVKAKAEGEEEEEPSAETDEEEEPSATVRTKIAAAERKRISDIRALGKPGEEATIQACIDDADCTVEMAAKRLRDAETKAGADRLAALKGDDAGAHATGAAAPIDQSPQAAAKSAVASFYALTEPKGSNQRAR